MVRTWSYRPKSDWSDCAGRDIWNELFEMVEAIREKWKTLEEAAEVGADRMLNAEYCEKRDTLFQLAMKAGYDINTEVGRLETLLGEKK